MSVNRDQRHLRAHPCPVCGGFDEAPRGQETRCHGFTSDDRAWCRCSRLELAGGIEANWTGLYAHKLHGDCRCGKSHEPARDQSIEAIYDYRDEAGELRFQVVRKTGKKFLQRRPDGPGGWIWKTAGLPMLLYRLPELIASSGPVYIVEGEKDVDTMYRHGHVATCNPRGAGQWKPVAEQAQRVLAGRDVIVIADADDKGPNPSSDPDTGRRQAKEVAESLRSVVCSLAILECPNVKDITDHFAAGGSLDDLVPMTDPAKTRATTVATFPNESAPDVGQKTKPLTDTGNAERFAEMFRERVRYCVPTKTWLLWDGTRWAADARGDVMGLAKEVARSIYAEAAQCNDADKRKAIAIWARKSESRGARSAMVELAQSEPGVGVLPKELDADPWLLNTPSCTVDLRTGIAREHRRGDMITRRTAAPVNMAKRSALWDRILLEAMGGDKELVAFLQRAAGYSCTGLTCEEKLFMPVGAAGSSKSTIIQAILRTLGDYAKTADFEAFIAQKTGGGPKNDIARLAGARLVASIEVDKGKRLAQGLVKTLTGGDVVTARFLYCEAVEFKPEFKLWLVCNDAPKVDDNDTGMWRRILRIPLDHVVPEAKRNPAVKAELTDPAQSGEAILAWLVEGALMWQAKGLAAPAAVQQATEGYRAEQDPIREFISEACFLEATVQCSRHSLRESYERWAKEAGDHAVLTGRDFNTRVRALPGIGEKKVNGTRFWTGIGIAVADDDAMYSGGRGQEGASIS
jgi:putative DNA primase/helicase